MQTLYLGLIIAVVVAALILYMATMNKENFDAYSGDDPIAVYTRKAAQGMGVKELDDAEYPENRQPNEYEKLWYTKGHHAAIQKEVLDSIDEIEEVEKSLDTLTGKFVAFQTKTTENFKAYGKRMDDFQTATDANFKAYGSRLDNLSGSLDERFGEITSNIADSNTRYEKAFEELKSNASNDMTAVTEEIVELKNDNDTVQKAVDALKITQDKMQKAYLALVSKQSEINKKQRDLETVKATTSPTTVIDPIVQADADSE
jgi:chromosome segregation ATPase